MYRDIYFHMTRTKVCTRLLEEHAFYFAGEIRDEKEKQGRVPWYRMDNPGKLMFVDSTGANTNQGKYGNIGGMKMLTTKSVQPKKISSFQDCHWTTFGWTVLTGEPVMCAIITPGKSAPSNDEITDLNAMAQLSENIMLDRDNPGPIFEDGDGKVYPIGPACIFNGKSIPTFVTTT
jgi:hypothetical protein